MAGKKAAFAYESKTTGKRAKAKAKESPVAETLPIATMKRRDPRSFAQYMKASRSFGAIDCSRKVHDLLAARMMKEDQEVFVVVGLDVRKNVRGIVEVARGQRSQVAVGVVDVLRAAITIGCESMVVVHVHPSGVCKPSPDDAKLTASIREALVPFGDELALVDHVIIGSGEYYSFLDNETHKVSN